MIRSLARRLSAEGRKDSGLSMVELLVAGMLTAMMLAMIGAIFMQVTRLTTEAIQTRNSTGEAASMSNGVTAVLRSATTLAKSGSEIPYPAIISGSNNALSLYSYANTSAADPAPVRVTYAVETVPGSNPIVYKLTETRCTGVASGGFWTFGSCASTIKRTLGTGIQSSASDRLFIYRDGNGDPIDIGTGSLLPTQLAQVGSITVTVRVQAATSKNSPVIITSTVVLRNLGLDTGS